MTIALPAERTTRISLAAALTIAIVAGYAALEVALFVTHDPWNDEGQAWRWAQQLDTFAEFFVIPGEGHPPLWFWILKVLQTSFAFDQARVLTLGIAILNATLLARLLRQHVLVLGMLLGSSILLTSWGYQFRPYGLMLTLLCCALLCDSAQKPAAALWLLTLGCGLHLFAGVFLGLYMLVLLSRRTPIRVMVAPAIVALGFAALVVLSAMGNHDGDIVLRNFVPGFYDIVTRPFRLNVIPTMAVFAVAPLLIAWSLRKTPFVLAALAVMIVLFATFSAVAYGRAEWHAAFILILVVMAFVLAGDAAPKWPLAVLLVPQVLLGLLGAGMAIETPQFLERDAYAAIVADAGDRLEPERNLVGFPDHALTATAARVGFAYLSGNDGSLVKVVNLRTRKHYQLDREFLISKPGPYWLLCHDCKYPVRILRAAGRTVTEIAAPREYLFERPLAAYRIDE